MPRRKRGAPPPYLHHKGSNQAYSTFKGKIVYHGVWDTDDSRKHYFAWVAGLDLEHREPVQSGTIAQLAADYLDQVASHFSRPERTNFKQDLQALTALYGTYAPDQFGPKNLKHVRDNWLKEGLARQTINKRVGRLRRLFRWGVSEERVREETLGALVAVDDLAAGRTNAPEYDEVVPVPLRDLARTLRFLSPVLAAMVRFQFYVGARPGEVCRLRSDELHRGWVAGLNVRVPEGAWAFTPTKFKTRWKGKFLVYMVGPRAQKVIAPFLGNGFVFSPKNRKIKKRKPIRAPGPHYRPDSYGHAIAKACEKAGVPVWSPNRLRHNWFTRITRIAGIAAASSAGGHDHISTTAIYVEKNVGEAAQLAMRHG